MTKKSLIKKIQVIIKEFGSFTTADVSAESSPCIGSLGGTNQLAEEFYHDKTKVICYDRNDNEVDEDNISYHDLKLDILEEIYILAQNWEAECLQNEDRQGKNQLYKS
jgi:hypothetical protein